MQSSSAVSLCRSNQRSRPRLQSCKYIELSHVFLSLAAVVLQIKWVAFEHFLALYIILAIGADDVFVFMDAYKQSFYAGPKVRVRVRVNILLG